MLGHGRSPSPPGADARLCGRLEALAAGFEAFHVGEHGQDGSPAAVDLGNNEYVPGWGAVVPDLAPGGTAPEVRGGGVVNVLAGDGPAPRGSPGCC